MFLLSYQNKLSDNFHNFSPYGGALLIKGGSGRYAEWKDWSTMVLKVFFLDLMAFPMHIKLRPNKISRVSI